MIFRTPSYSDTLRADIQPSYRDSLSHHGIKGMKWGVRRFQNPDGSLTSQGRKRYGSGNSRGGNGLASGGLLSAIKKYNDWSLENEQQRDAMRNKSKDPYKNAIEAKRNSDPKFKDLYDRAQKIDGAWGDDYFDYEESSPYFNKVSKAVSKYDNDPSEANRAQLNRLVDAHGKHIGTKIGKDMVNKYGQDAVNYWLDKEHSDYVGETRHYKIDNIDYNSLKKRDAVKRFADHVVNHDEYLWESIWSY